MICCQPDSLRYYTFGSLEGLVHGVFTRQGGASLPPFASLNVGGTVGDEPSRVEENRRKVFHTLNRPRASLYDVWQVHSAEVVCAESPRQPSMPHSRADAILTDKPGVTLFMRFADCVPVILWDPVRQVTGLAHAGWQGTLKKTASAAVHVMQERYDSQPADILAAIGPSIGPHHYPVGEEVAAQFEHVFGDEAAGLLNRYQADGNPVVELDLWSANSLVLHNAGVRKIEAAQVCTACHLDDWYSHRAEQGQTGRFGVLVAVATSRRMLAIG